MFIIRTVAENKDTDPDFLAHGKVRYAVYVEERGWVKAAGLPDHREVDQFDPISVCAVAYDMLTMEGEAVGSIRHITRNGEPLPVETEFGVEVDPTRNVVEVSRLAVTLQTRGTIALLGLFKWVVRESQINGIDDLYAIVEPSLLTTLNGFGFPFTALTPAKKYFGDLTLAVHCHADQLVSGVEEQDRLTSRRPLAPFFRDSPTGDLYVDKETIYQ